MRRWAGCRLLVVAEGPSLCPGSRGTGFPGGESGVLARRQAWAVGSDLLGETHEGGKGGICYPL